MQTTELIARGAPIPGSGVSPAVDAVAFTLPAGGVSDPIVTDTGAVIVKVLEKKDVTPAELTAGKSQVRDELLERAPESLLRVVHGQARGRR